MPLPASALSSASRADRQVTHAGGEQPERCPRPVVPWVHLDDSPERIPRPGEAPAPQLHLAERHQEIGLLVAEQGRAQDAVGIVQLARLEEGLGLELKRGHARGLGQEHPVQEGDRILRAPRSEHATRVEQRLQRNR